MYTASIYGQETIIEEITEATGHFGQMSEDDFTFDMPNKFVFLHYQSCDIVDIEFSEIKAIEHIGYECISISKSERENYDIKVCYKF